MQFLEKDLETIIYETDNTKLQSKGLDINGVKKRQLKIGNYGIADLVTFRTDIDQQKNKLLEITVYELKQKQLTIGAFLQAVRYCKGIRNYLIKHRQSPVLFYFNIVLIGRDIDVTSSFVYLPELLFNFEPVEFSIFSLSMLTYNYEIDGLTFNPHHVYSLTNEGFNG